MPRLARTAALVLALSGSSAVTGCESLDGLSGGVRDASEGDTAGDSVAEADVTEVASDVAIDADAGPDRWKPVSTCRGEWCFVNPLPQGFALLSVWAESVDRFYAVGAAGTFLRYDKGTWSEYDTGGITTTFTDVDGASASDLWIVGKGPSTVLRYDGAKLTPLASPTPSDLTRVRVRGPKDVWVARVDGAPYRWDGKDFVPTADGVPTSRAWYVNGLGLLGASGAPSAGLAVGQLGFAARWDGVQWVEAPAPFLLAPSQATWLAAADDGWDCADYGTKAPRWDGKAWSAIEIGHRCRGLAGRAADDVWLVGNGVSRWNGLGIEKRDTALRTVDLRAIALPAVDRAVAVGSGGLALRWDGSAWSRAAGGVLAQLDPDLFWASVLTLDDTEVWLTGRPRVLRWDGASASTFADAPLDLRGCLLRAKGDLWCAASGGVARWNGGWTTPVSTPFVELVAIDGTKDEVWAVSSGGQIRHFDGTKWESETSGVTTPLRAVFARSATEVWALGDGGVALRRDATGWKAAPSLAGDVAHLARRSDLAIARLTSGAFVRYAGGAWVAMEAPAIKTVWITIAADGTAFAGGPNGVARWSGTAWTTVGAPPITATGGGIVGGKLWVVDETGVVMARPL